MPRSELCARVAAHSSLSKAYNTAALGARTSTIADALAEGETVTVAGFGTFTARTHTARQGRNPRTGEPVYRSARRRNSRIKGVLHPRGMRVHRGALFWSQIALWMLTALELLQRGYSTRY